MGYPMYLPAWPYDKGRTTRGGGRGLQPGGGQGIIGSHRVPLAAFGIGSCHDGHGRVGPSVPLLHASTVALTPRNASALSLLMPVTLPVAPSLSA